MGLLSGASWAAQAHPADEGRVDVVFRARDGRLNWTVDWWFGNLAGLQFWSTVLDKDNDAVLSPQEQQAFADLAAGASGHWPVLRLDDETVTPVLEVLTIADYTAFISLPATPQIHAELTAPLPKAPEFWLALHYAAANGLAFTARFPAGGGVRVQEQSLTREWYRAQVRVPSTVAGAPASVEAPTAEAATQAAGAARFWALIAAGAGLIIATAAVIGVLSLLRRYRGRDHT